MNISRRNFLTGAGALGAAAALPGCHTLQTEEKTYAVGTAFGGTTGLVLDQCDIEAEVRNRIITIVGLCRTVVPKEGQTVWDAWYESAKAYVDAAVQGGELTPTQGDLILAGYSLVLKGLKLLVERHPEVGTYGALTVAAIGGFCDGFLAVYKPIDGEHGCEDGCCEITIDQKAFKALKASAEVRSFRLKALRAAVAR